MTKKRVTEEPVTEKGRAMSAGNGLAEVRDRLFIKKNTVDLIYLIVFGIYYVYMFLGTSMISDKWLVPLYRLCMIAVLFIAAYRFLTLRKEEWRLGVLMVCLIAATAGFYLRSHLKLYVIWGLMIIGAKDVDFKRIARIALIAGTGVMIAALIASQTGLVEDLVYEVPGRLVDRRHSLGMSYCTDCAAHVLFLMLAYCYLKEGCLKLWQYAILAVLTAVIYLLTGARNNMICMAILIVATFVYQYGMQKLFFGSKGSVYTKIFSILFIVTVLLCIVSILYLSFTYSSEIEWLQKLNQQLGHRFSMGKQAFDEYGLKLFGSEIPQMGNGRTTDDSSFYFWLDSSYVSVILEQGIVLFVMMVVIHLLSMVRAIQLEKNGIYTAGLLVIVALACWIEGHWRELAYNIFLLMMFAKLSSGGKLAEESKM